MFGQQDSRLPLSGTTLTVVSSVVGLALVAWPIGVWYASSM